MNRRPTITSVLGFRAGWKTDTGQVRERNEDDFLLLSAPALAPAVKALFVVADGMGGHQAGDFASSYLVSRLRELFTSDKYQENVYYNVEHPDYFAVVLKEVLERINEELYTLSSTHPQLRGMGTTVTVALLVEERLFIGHVGDTRAYLLRNGELRQLTTDHSWVAEQVRAGALTWDEAAQHPRKNVLTRSLGASLVVRVDRVVCPLQDGDRLLLASDGLINHVKDSELHQALMSHTDAQAACDWLVELANQRGGTDNITVIVAHFGTGLGLPSLDVQRKTSSPLAPEAPATLKVARVYRRKTLLTPVIARRIRYILSVWLISVVFGLLVSVLAWQLSTQLETRLPPKFPLALGLGITAAICLLIGIFVGIVLSPRWWWPTQSRARAKGPNTPDR